MLDSHLQMSGWFILMDAVTVDINNPAIKLCSVNPRLAFLAGFQYVGVMC